MEFDEKLILKFAHNFFGYGNLSSNLWFIGMEEGGGNSFTEIETRLSMWEVSVVRYFETEGCLT